MAYSTKNPVGSTDPRDMYDNAGVLDQYMNGQNPLYPDRFGVMRLSLSGQRYNFEQSMSGWQAAFQAFLQASGYEAPVSYAAGLLLERATQTFVRNNIQYRINNPADLPYTLTGEWDQESEYFASMGDSALRQNLADVSGSSIVGYQAVGAGTTARTVEAKLRDIVSRLDYSSASDFNSARVGRPNIDGNGNFDARVLPSGGNTPVALSQLASDSALVSTAGPREAILYGSSTSVTVSRVSTAMGGFRFRGQMSRPRSKLWPLPATSRIASVSAAGLGAETAVRTENWYAVFACANDGDASAVLKTMPFLRVGSVAGNVITLNKAGEGIHSVVAQTYAWSTGLAGVQCLVIGENGRWSGRIATITANTPTTIALDNAGGLAFGDYLLPAPPGWQHFNYLGSLYFDTAEVRNIYDDGLAAQSRGIYILQPSYNGSIPAPGIELNASGYVCPLALGVMIDASCSISTSSTGGFAENWSNDGSNHVTFAANQFKASAASSSHVVSGIRQNFLYPGKFWYYNGQNPGAGLLENRINGQMNIRGFFEL